MGKHLKYEEDVLLEAVIKYSEIVGGKIKATELAEWCRKNIKGLEEVRDYHFTRPVLERNIRTGKMVKKERLCTQRMREINKTRSLAVSLDTNVLLKAHDINIFMELKDLEKRKMIAETRRTVEELFRSNGVLMRENEVLRAENNKMKEEISSVSERVKKLQKMQEKLTKQVAYLMRVTDESAQRQMLSQMGVQDGYVDLVAYNNSLSLGIDEVMNINQRLKRYLSKGVEVGPTIVESKKSVGEEILNGLRWEK